MFVRTGLLSALFALPLLVTAVPTAKVAKNAKRGLCFADSDHTEDISKATGASSVLTWVYDWGTSPKSYLASSGLEYTPMQWGPGGIESFDSIIQGEKPKEVLAFNEPDNAGQSNMTPGDAAALWKQYIEPLKSTGARLGAPAVTNGPDGTTWLSQFLGNCTGCSVDFVPFHWYGEGVGSFYDYIWSFHGQFPNYPLWVTEFGSTSSDDATVLDFLNQTTTYMDSLDWIERYSWFALFRYDGSQHYSLLDANGNLNALGSLYINGA